MSDFDWLKKSDDKTVVPKDEPDTVGFEETKEDDPATVLMDKKGEAESNELLEIIKEIKEEKEAGEKTTVILPKGDAFDPFKNFSVLALVDLAPGLKKIRPDLIPSFFHLKRRVTLIGTGKKAHVKLDDVKTIKKEHGAIAFHKGGFFLYPQEDVVKLDGVPISKEGAPLSHGSKIELGSARFIFLSVVPSG